MLKKTSIMAFAMLIIAWFSGCTPKQLGEGGIFSKKPEKPEDKNPSLVNYALASHGAKVQASGSTHGQSPENVINGITDSLAWDNGEGWECQFSLTSYYRPGYAMALT